MMIASVTVGMMAILVIISTATVDGVLRRGRQADLLQQRGS